MKRVILATALVVGANSLAYGDSCEVNPSTPVYTPDDTAISVIFDSFFGEPGNPGTCHLEVSANSNTPADPDIFAVYSADYRGFVDPSETAHFEVAHNGVTEEADLDGNDDPLYSHFIGKDDDGNLTSDITLSQDAGTGAFIDTLDYAQVATMARADAEASLDQINLGETALITHLGAMTGLLTGGNLSMTGDNEVGVFGGVGSYQAGIRGRYNLAQGFSLLGGVSIVDLASTGATARGLVGALALRYVDPNAQELRLYGEGGVELGSLAFSFDRTYTDSTGAHAVTGTGDGGIGGIYVKGGVIWSPDSSNEVLFSTSLKESSLGITDYSEPFSPANFFAADLSGTTTNFTTAKAGADWTLHLTPEVDLTASAALGTTFANGGTSADIFGGGATAGTAQSTVFAEYGLRVGWMPAANATIDGFIQGTTGTGIGTHLQVGGGARMKF